MGNLDPCFTSEGTSKHLYSSCSPVAPTVFYSLCVPAQRPTIMFSRMSNLAQSGPNLFLEWKWGNWQRQQQNCQQFSNFINDYTSVSSHILCNCTYNWVTSVITEDKGQPNTMAEEEKQALPLNMIKRSWFHGWVAVVIEGILITLQVT